MTNQASDRMTPPDPDALAQLVIEMLAAAANHDISDTDRMVLREWAAVARTEGERLRALESSLRARSGAQRIEERSHIEKAARHYFNKGRCSGHDQFNGRYCRDATDWTRWCIHCAGFMLLTVTEQMADELMRGESPTDAAAEKCCERDTDSDGNCDRHLAPGVLRGWPLSATQPAPLASAGAETPDAFRCANRETNDWTTDCNWPLCGCDPHADKVIAALQESGHLPASPAHFAAAETFHKPGCAHLESMRGNDPLEPCDCGARQKVGAGAETPTREDLRARLLTKHTIAVQQLCIDNRINPERGHCWACEAVLDMREAAAALPPTPEPPK